MTQEKPERKRQLNNTYGGVAQLGEHLPCKQGVMGSNPIISTKVQTKQTKESKVSTAGTKGRNQKLHGLIAQVARARA